MTTSELITLNNHRNKQNKIRTIVRGDLKMAIARLYEWENDENGKTYLPEKG